MTEHGSGGGNEFVIPARTLRGSRREMLEDIDQAIVGLLALRHLIGDGTAPPDRLPQAGANGRRRRSRWSAFLAAALPAAFGS